VLKCRTFKICVDAFKSGGETKEIKLDVWLLVFNLFWISVLTVFFIACLLFGFWFSAYSFDFAYVEEYAFAFAFPAYLALILNQIGYRLLHIRGRRRGHALSRKTFMSNFHVRSKLIRKSHTSMIQ